MALPPPPSYQQATNYNTEYAPAPQGQNVPGQYPPNQYPPQQGFTSPQQGYGYAPPTQPGYPPTNAPVYPPTAQGGYTNPAQPGFIPKDNVTSVEVPNDGTNGSGWQSDDGQPLGGASFSDKSIRRAFIRKVYLILTAQLLVTVAFICFFMYHTPTRNWVRANSWFYYCSYATFLVTYITLVCCKGVRRKWPANFICMTIFTLAFSYMTATISSFYATDIVLIAAGITAAVTLSISIFAIQTKFDFTMCGGILFALCMVLFFFGIACMIVAITTGPSYILRCVYGALAALLFSLFLAYDTQMLIGGRKHELSPEEYIYGALQLYLDIVYIFLIILSFFGKSGD